jgi:hypothetical protein
MPIKVTGLREAIAEARGLAGRFRDARPWTQQAATKMRAASRTAISSATEPDGTPWEPLANATLKQKKGTQQGVESGRTLGSLEAYWDSTSALMRAPTPLGVWINSGTFDMPERRFVAAKDGVVDAKLSAELVADYIAFVRADL